MAVEVIYTEDQEPSKLRPRLIAAFLLVSLAPLLLLEYFNQRATRQALIDAAYRALYASATQTAQAIDGFLNESGIVGRARRLSGFKEPDCPAGSSSECPQ